MILSLGEIFDLVIMTAALGYIFMDSFRRTDDPWQIATSQGFRWDDFWYACLVVAPSIILHEMAHKFVALGFGLEATFHAALEWLALGIILKVLNFGFIFFVPGYVSISGIGNNLEFGLSALAGPLVHLILWLGVMWYLNNWEMTQSREKFWHLTMQINKFLFILNMLPIPGFDGFKVYESLFAIIF